VASEGTGVLQTLTTLSKLVLAELRKAVDNESSKSTPARPRPAAATLATAVASPLTGRASAGAEKGFQIESAGPVDGGGSEITIPVRLVDEASGRRVEIAVRIAIDSL
jgi:hypothetical protein